MSTYERRLGYTESSAIDQPDAWVIPSVGEQPALKLTFETASVRCEAGPLSAAHFQTPYWYELVPHDRLLELRDWLGERIEALGEAVQMNSIELVKARTPNEVIEADPVALAKLAQRMILLQGYFDDLDRDLPF